MRKIYLSLALLTSPLCLQAQEFKLPNLAEENPCKLDFRQNMISATFDVMEYSLDHLDYDDPAKLYLQLEQLREYIIMGRYLIGEIVEVNEHEFMYK